MRHFRTILLFGLIAMFAAGCEPYRVEYHPRPAYREQAAIGELPDRVRKADGTTIVYSDPRQGSNIERRARGNGERREFKIREERDDGSIVLRGLIPEHVMANLVECLQNEEYELIYEELLSQVTRDAWEAEGRDIEDFADYLASHRREMIRSVNRMYMGLPQFDAVMESLEDGVIEVRLRGNVAPDLGFRRIRVISEGYGLKLLTIR